MGLGDWCFPGHLPVLVSLFPIPGPHNLFCAPKQQTLTNMPTSLIRHIKVKFVLSSILVEILQGLLHPTAGQGKDICVLILGFMRYNGGLKIISAELFR